MDGIVNIALHIYVFRFYVAMFLVALAEILWIFGNLGGH